jgi:hypothetical protein
MRKADVDSRILGDAYEYLIAKFADDAGKKGGEFYTPKQVVRLMVEILRPEEGMTVYDPACGSGGMLLEAVHFMERQRRRTRSRSPYGQEKNLNTWAICKMSLFLHDIDDAFIERGDTLLDPKHLSGEKVLKRFDLVLANPPFSLSPWGHEEWKKGDKFGRDTYGCPPKSYGDLAFVQHMVASLKSNGRMAVVVPHGVLFRGGEEGKIRKGLLEDDLIEAVVGSVLREPVLRHGHPGGGAVHQPEEDRGSQGRPPTGAPRSDLETIQVIHAQSMPLAASRPDGCGFRQETGWWLGRHPRSEEVVIVGNYLFCTLIYEVDVRPRHAFGYLPRPRRNQCAPGEMEPRGLPSTEGRPRPNMRPLGPSVKGGAPHHSAIVGVPWIQVPCSAVSSRNAARSARRSTEPPGGENRGDTRNRPVAGSSVSCTGRASVQRSPLARTRSSNARMSRYARSSSSGLSTHR